MNSRSCDVVIVGAGIAGLSTALSFNTNTSIIIISENLPTVSGSTPFAQGGIAFSENNDESIFSHIQDTLSAGAGICDEEVVKTFISRSADTIEWLGQQNVEFDRDDNGSIKKGREAAHSTNRIAHIGGDATGIGFVTAMLNKAKSLNNIEFIIGKLSSLLTDSNGTACGVEIDGGKITSSSVVFATGGASGLFGNRTAPSQPSTAFKLAIDAGAKASDMEFFQHHPTALDLPYEVTSTLDRIPLISEAVRGQGAILTSGNDLLKIEDKDASLAPRDVVSRAVFNARGQGKRVFLDTSSITNFEDKFPTIAKICKKYSVNTKKIPVRNAMHYQIGGISANATGTTDVDGLYVVGEAASTGLHGANRLASNSLLEASIMGRLCAEKIQTSNIRGGKIKNRIAGQFDGFKSVVQDTNNHSLGMSRNFSNLKDALLTLTALPQTPNVVASQMANLFAILRTESIGSHYRSDFPEKKSLPRNFMTLETFNKEMKQII